MKKVLLSGSLRENVGKKDTKAVRASGRIPCVLYGGKEQLHFSIDVIAFDKVINTPNVYLIDLELGKETYQAIIQDLQFHPVSDRVLHVDFLQVMPDKKITVALPVSFTGSAAGVMAGGKLYQMKRKLQVRGLIDDMPDEITLDITSLKIGQAIKVMDVKLDNIELMDIPSELVVTVKTARGAGEDEAEEEDSEESEGADETAAEASDS